MRIAVFSTFDITPGQNGGEIRFQSLYRRLSYSNDVRIISYDLFCGVPLKRGRLAPSVDTITAGVSDSDRYRMFTTMEQTGLFPHDVMCVSEYDFTSAFAQETRWNLAWADVVVVTTPFLSKYIFPQCGSGQLKIYEAHNVEGRAKRQFFATSQDPAITDRLLNDTIDCEASALEAADIVLSVSAEDAKAFVDDYDVSADKIHFVPNGVDVGSFDAIPDDAKHAFRKCSDLAGMDVGVFLGSAYGPNVDSYRLTRRWLDEAGFSGAVIVIGRIAEAHDSTWPLVGFTEHWMGFVDDATKRLIVGSADFALQIMTGGGGTNLKLFDYMAAGVPILANSFGARGVSVDGWFIPVDSSEVMRDVVNSRGWKSDKAAHAARVARDTALRDFDWDRIADRYRAILA